MIASTGILLMAAGLSSRYRYLSGQHNLQTPSADGNPFLFWNGNLLLGPTLLGGML